MKLQELKKTEDPSLVVCHMCYERESLNIASRLGWVVDLDDGSLYYCPECKHFFINELDIEHI